MTFDFSSEEILQIKYFAAKLLILNHKLFKRLSLFDVISYCQGHGLNFIK